MNAPPAVRKTHYTFGDYLYWSLLLAVPFLSALMSAWKTSVALAAGYLAVLAAMAVVLVRFFCIRCPHYGTGKNGTTRCIFQWGIPALFERREGPYTKWELIASAAAGAVIVLLPLTWLRSHLPLMAVYVLSVGVVAATLRRFECTRCVHGNCPSHCGAAEPPAQEAGKEP